MINLIRIVVSGGDGTLNEAVKGLMEFDADKRPCLGYIPAGTTNDFASTLELPKSIAKSSDIAVNGVPFKCDIGKFNSTTFNYVAAFGAFTDVPYDTPAGSKKHSRSYRICFGGYETAFFPSVLSR